MNREAQRKRAAYAKELHTAGWKVKAIANELKVSENSVWPWLRWDGTKGIYNRRSVRHFNGPDLKPFCREARGNAHILTDVRSWVTCERCKERLRTEDRQALLDSRMTDQHFDDLMNTPAARMVDGANLQRLKDEARRARAAELELMKLVHIPGRSR